MKRILSTGTLLLVLAGITWTFPGCDDGPPVCCDTTPSHIDAPLIPVDTSAALPDAPTPTVDTTAALPDAAPVDAT
jgi:hypothetical protein